MYKLFLQTIFLICLVSCSCASDAHEPLPAISDSASQLNALPATTNGASVRPFSSVVQDVNAKLRPILAIEDRPLKPQPDKLVDMKLSREDLVERNKILGPFKDYKDYQSRALSKVPIELRSYGIKGLTNVRVVLTEEYARQLESRKSDQEARIKPQSDLKNRVSPADLPGLVEEMPDPRYFKRIFISDKANPEDDWVTQIYFPKGFISATAMTEGELNLYKTNLTSYLRRDVMHEWGHELRLKFWDNPVRERFHDAVELETDWNPRNYAARGDSEQWAVLGERLLGTSADDFLEACEKAPIRTTLWTIAFQRCLSQVPLNCLSVHHEQYTQRANYVLNNVGPKAIAQIELLKRSEKSQPKRHDADRILTFLTARR